MAYGRRFNMQVRIARFPELLRAGGHLRKGARKGTRCNLQKGCASTRRCEDRSVGDGSAVRSFTYIDDMVDGSVVSCSQTSTAQLTSAIRSM